MPAASQIPQMPLSLKRHVCEYSSLIVGKFVILDFTFRQGALFAMGGNPPGSEVKISQGEQNKIGFHRDTWSSVYNGNYKLCKQIISTRIQ